jgi:hypothetical protein
MASLPIKFTERLPSAAIYNHPLLVSLAAVAMVPVVEASINSSVSRYLSPAPAVAAPSFTQQITAVDKSGTINVGGVPQVIIGANSSRRAFIVSNPASAKEVLQVSLGAAGHYMDLLPGAVWETGAVVWPGNIYVRAKTSGHQFTAYEGS